MSQTNICYEPIYVTNQYILSATCNTIDVQRILHGMVWLQLVGSIRPYVSFADFCLLYRALLQKRRKI